MNWTSNFLLAASRQPSGWEVFGWCALGVVGTVAVFVLIVAVSSAYNVWQKRNRSWTEWRYSETAINYTGPGAMCGPMGCLDYPESFTLVERQSRENLFTKETQWRSLVVRPLTREEADRSPHKILW